MAVQRRYSDKSVKRIVDSVVRDSTGAILVVPTATDASIQPNVDIQELERVNCNGELETERRYFNAKKPAFQITFPFKTPSVYGLALNQKVEAGASATIDMARNQYIVPDSGTVAAKAAGVFGNGLTADPAGCVGAYMDENGQEQPLTYVNTFASFDAAGSTESFAVGADGAMAFSDDLQGKEVSYVIPVPVTAFARLGSTGFTNLQLDLTVVRLDLTIERFVADVSLDNPGDVSLSEPAQQLSFFVNGNVEYYSLGELTPC